ncbi:uncharacterized protein ColSpa_09725 [Colletotrichum spaethianum]|uniref:Uncharacterized protein n=1 Tax=Colletotrichum spaethianum TaxID=700344 RepID=A0AA37PC74_9PEZI|nr:uncharacterized protein ColSpa_09725 [Colletotrichum spaethianum]GKT49543.1 hypothetical protein ColSpa_09725 [Colletotrichum spaethianum]
MKPSHNIISAYFFLPPPRAATKAVEQTVEAQGTEKAVDNLAEAEAVEKTTDEVEDTGQQETDSSQNLEERLGEETPQRVELLLGTLCEVVLLGSSLTSLGLGLGVLLDATIRVQGTDTAIQLGQDLATLLDKRLNILHKLLLVTLLLGLALGCLNLLRNHLADRTQTVEALLNESADALGQLAVGLSLLAGLLLLFGLSRNFLNLGDVLEQGDVSDNTVLGVNNVVVAVDLLARANGHLAGSKLADDVSIFIDNLTLAVDTAAFHRTLFLRKVLEKGDMADHTILGVDDVVILVDLLASTNAELTAGKHAQGLTGLANDLTLLVDGLAFHGTLRLGNILKELDVADNASLGVDDVVVFVDDLAGASLDLSRGKLADDIAILVNDITAAVDLTALHGTLLPLGSGFGLPAFSLTEEVAIAIKDVAILVDGAPEKGLSVTLNKTANNVSRRSNNGSVLGDGTSRKLRERTLLCTLTVALRDELSTADDVARLAADVTLLVAHAANQLLDITLDDTAVDGTVLVDNVASLVDALACKGRVINHDRRLGFRLRLRLRLPTLGLANGIAALVKNVTLVINLLALQLLRVTLNDATNNVAIEENMTVRFNSRTREVLKRRGLSKLFTLSLRNRLSLSNDLAGIVPDLATLISLAADKVLEDTRNNTANSFALVVDEVTSLVDLGTLEDGELGLADDAAALVDDIALGVDGHANEVGRITFGDAANRGVVENDLALIINLGTRELLEWLKELVASNSDSALIFGDGGADGAQDALNVVLDGGLGSGVGRGGNINIRDVTSLCILGRIFDTLFSTLSILNALSALNAFSVRELGVLGNLGLILRVLLVGPVFSRCVLRSVNARLKLGLRVEGDLGDGNVGSLDILGKLALQVVGDLRHGYVKGSNVVGDSTSLLCSVVLDGLSTLSLLLDGLSIHLLQVILSVKGRLLRQICLVALGIFSLCLGVFAAACGLTVVCLRLLGVLQDTSKEASERVLLRAALLRLTTAKGSSDTTQKTPLRALLRLTAAKDASKDTALAFAQTDALCQITNKCLYCAVNGVDDALDTLGGAHDAEAAATTLLALTALGQLTERKRLADDATVFADDIASRGDNVADKLASLAFCDLTDSLAGLIYHLSRLADNTGNKVLTMLLNILFDRLLNLRQGELKLEELPLEALVPARATE